MYTPILSESLEEAKLVTEIFVEVNKQCQVMLEEIQNVKKIEPTERIEKPNQSQSRTNIEHSKTLFNEASVPVTVLRNIRNMDKIEDVHDYVDRFLGGY